MFTSSFTWIRYVFAHVRNARESDKRFASIKLIYASRNSQQLHKSMTKLVMNNVDITRPHLQDTSQSA